MSKAMRQWRGATVWATHLAVWEDEACPGHVTVTVDEGPQERALQLAPDTAREMADALYAAADAADTRGGERA